MILDLVTIQRYQDCHGKTREIRFAGLYLSLHYARSLNKSALNYNFITIVIQQTHHCNNTQIISQNKCLKLNDKNSIYSITKLTLKKALILKTPG